MQFRQLLKLPYCKKVALLTQKAESNRETLESPKFQEWLIEIQANRIQTTNKINKT